MRVSNVTISFGMMALMAFFLSFSVQMNPASRELFLLSDVFFALFPEECRFIGNFLLSWWERSKLVLMITKGNSLSEGGGTSLTLAPSLSPSSMSVQGEGGLLSEYLLGVEPTVRRVLFIMCKGRREPGSEERGMRQGCQDP